MSPTANRALARLPARGSSAPAASAASLIATRWRERSSARDRPWSSGAPSPLISVTRWVLATAGAAAYLLALLPWTTATVTAAWPVPVLVVSAVALGLLVLLTIGVAQWSELRRHIDPAAAWIGITALAWLLGLGIFLAVAMPLWHPGQSVPVAVLIGLLAGTLMALVMAAVTGAGLVVLLRGSQGRATGLGTSGATFGPEVGSAGGGSSGAIPVRRGERS